MTSDKQKLIVEHIDFAKRIARAVTRWVHSRAVREEAVSAALLGLVEVANKYDETRGPFEVYASKRINGAVQDFLRTEDLISRGERKKFKAGDMTVIPRLVQYNDRHPASDQRVDEVAMATRRCLIAAMKKLPETDRQILSDYYSDKSLREIGADLDVTESRICQRLKEIKNRLKLALTGTD